jgi:cation diffusion facilitator family transporter
MRWMPKTGTVVYLALAGNLLVAASKFAVAAVGHSSAMWSEGMHSLVDSANGVVLLYGLHRAAMPADDAHPFGHGRELYFWSFVVALLILSLGAGAAMFEGITNLGRSAHLGDFTYAYAVLGIAALLEGSSWLVARRHFKARKGRWGYLDAMRRSKDPASFMVLLEDSAALLGIALACAGLLLTQLMGLSWADGAASIGIGGVLAVCALLLARETKDLLIGEPAHEQVRDIIVAYAAGDPCVDSINGAATIQMGPRHIFVALSAEFRDNLTTSDIESCVERIERKVEAERDEVVMLFIKPQTPKRWLARHKSDT